MSKTLYIVAFALIGIAALTAAQPSSAISTNNCSCHSGRSLSFDILEGNTGNTLPTSLDVGQTTTVRVVVRNTPSPSTLTTSYVTLSGVSLTLSSQNGHFSVSTPTFSVGPLAPSTATATWTITGVSAGADSLVISGKGTNSHQGISFSDNYSPAPSITVAAPPPTTYTLTVTTSGQGTVAKSPNAASYTAGTQVQLTATPSAGWSFAGWSGGLTGASNPASVTVNSNTAVTATFTQNPPPPPTTYTLTVTTSGQGTVAKRPNAASYTAGSTVQLTATPSIGWSFAGWSVGLTGTTNPASVTVNSNTAVTATFTQNPPPTTYSVVVTITDSSTTALLSGATVTLGTSTQTTGADGKATFSVAAGTYALATSKTGYGSASQSVTVSADTSITKSLTPNPPTTPETYAVILTVTDSMASSAIAGATAALGSTTYTTGSDGKATFNIAAGAYTLSVSKSGYSSDSISVTVSADTSLNVALVPVAIPPPPTTGGLNEVEIRVNDEVTHRLVSGVQVTLGSLSGVTDGEGEVEFEGVSSGSLTLTLTKEGYAPKSTTVNVDGEVELSLPLRPMSPTTPPPTSTHPRWWRHHDDDEHEHHRLQGIHLEHDD